LILYKIILNLLSDIGSVNMSNEAEELSDINRKHREKMLLLKSRAESIFNKPSPLTTHQINLKAINSNQNQQGEKRNI
jgi:hypothetical protein